MKLHTCCPTIHYKNKQASAIWFLKDHHCASVVDNCDITPAQIQSNERLRFHNNISYIQAYRVKQALLAKIKGYEANCFARFLAFLQHMADTDEGSQGRLTYNEETGYFEAAAFVPSANEETGRFKDAAFAPSATINACRNI
jgi:hypothetical protein